MRSVCVLAAVALVAGCGGAEFGAGGAGDAAPDTTGPAPMDASADADATASDAGADAADAAREDSGGSDSTADVRSDGGAEAEAGIGDAGTPHDAGADATDAMDAGPDGAADADAEACVPVTYFLDGDGDGYGGTTTYVGCIPPPTGIWVTKGGDCDDSNATVNPGQSAYFAAGYVPTGKITPSFDYNCDGQETESGSPAKAFCKAINLACTGSGYIEAVPVRSGGGIDPFCGSNQAVNCAFVGLSCQQGAPYAASPIACH